MGTSLRQLKLLIGIPSFWGSKRYENIQEDFGASEIMLIAFGNKEETIYTKDIFDAIWDLTTVLETHELIEEVISIKTMNKLNSDDGFMEVDDLFPYRDLDTEDIYEIKKYIESNSDIKTRVVSSNNDYT